MRDVRRVLHRRVRNAAISWAHSIGVDITRWPRNGSYEALLSRLLLALDVDSVIDIGANVGQFGRSIRSLGYGGPILSVEPGRDAFRHLQRECRDDATWVARKFAVGDETGSVSLNVGVLSDLSSLLPINDDVAKRLGEGCDVRVAATEQVDMVTVDSLHPPGNRIFLKVDTQGYDRKVLEGAGSTLERTVAVQCELAFNPLYVGATNEWRSTVRWLEIRGFALSGIYSIASDDASVLQEADGLFVRSPEATARSSRNSSRSSTDAQ